MMTAPELVVARSRGRLQQEARRLQRFKEG
jgi:hypothetical protein